MHTEPKPDPGLRLRYETGAGIAEKSRGTRGKSRRSRRKSRKVVGREQIVFEAYPAELRPVLTRHRLRRRRHRSAASVLAGAALALGISASRPVPASAAALDHTNPADSASPTPAGRVPVHHSQRPTPRHASPTHYSTATDRSPESRQASPMRHSTAAVNQSPESGYTPSRPGRHARPAPAPGFPQARATTPSDSSSGHGGLPPPCPVTRAEEPTNN